MRISGPHQEYLRPKALDGHNYRAVRPEEWSRSFSIIWFRADDNLLSHSKPL